MTDLDAGAFIPQVAVRGPKRRQQLVDATVRILLRDGVTGVTHRSVSEESGLPLSATSYYFTSLDDLIFVTFQALYASFLTDWLQSAVPASADPLEDIAESFYAQLTGRREAYLVFYELHLTAARRPELRGYATILWDQQIRQFQELLDISRETATALSATLDGFAFAHLSVGDLPDRDHFRRALQHIVKMDEANTAATPMN